MQRFFEMLNWLSNSIFLHKRFKESRSRSLKDRVNRGLGQRLNKQKTICSVEAEWMVFRICIYRCIACQVYRLECDSSFE